MEVRRDVACMARQFVPTGTQFRLKSFDQRVRTDMVEFRHHPFPLSIKSADELHLSAVSQRHTQGLDQFSKDRHHTWLPMRMSV